MSGGIHYLPISHTFFYLLSALLLAVMVLIGLGILRYTYESIGIQRRYMFSLLLLSLLGSYVNIPVFELPQREVVTRTMVDVWGVYYLVPSVVDWPGTIIAVNLGGALIPVALSLYLIWKNRFLGKALAGIAVVTLVTHLLAQPVRGVGIAVPFFEPPLVACIAAYLLSRRGTAALAFVSGSVGTLLGADLLNLNAIAGLGAPVASIGGAGTFDSIFLTAVFAVLLAGLLGANHQRAPTVESNRG